MHKSGQEAGGIALRSRETEARAAKRLAVFGSERRGAVWVANQLREAILEGARPPELEPFRLERFTSARTSRSRAGLPFRRSSA